MIITPLNVAAIAESVLGMLRAWPALAALGVKITRGELINQDPSACPWVGCYAIGQRYEMRTLGLGSGYRRQLVDLVIVTQQSTQIVDDGGAVCMDALELLNQNVVSCLLSDPSLGGNVYALDGFSVQYASAKTQAGEPNFQSSIINFTGEKPVSGG